MRPQPGDEHVSKAEVRMFDASGMQVEGQFLLEAETAETRLTMPPGGHMEITEHERRDVFDAEQKAAVPIGTAEREANIDSPNTPQPRDEREQRKHEEEFAKKHNKEVEEKRKKYDEEYNKKYGGEGVDAKELRMKEERERKERQEQMAKSPQASGYAVDTSKPVDPYGTAQSKPVETKHGGKEADMSKGIDTSKDQHDPKAPTHKK